MNGWIGRVLRVDLNRSDFVVEDLDPDVAIDYIGGRGLGVKVMYDEVDPKVDPLSPENKLIFATGPLTGTGAPTGGRYMAISKSPLTETIGYSNAGGHFGPELKFAGYDMIIIEGKAPSPVYLSIDNDEVQIRPAEHLWGKNTYETEDLIKAEVGDKWKAMDTHIATIGPAGEKLVKIAAIMCDKGRAAGRSGLGAVMGSKNLKAIAVRGTRAVTVDDGESFKEAMMALLERVKKERITSELLPMYGTMNAQFGMNRKGTLPTRNYQAGSFEGVANTNARPLRANFLIRNRGCFACPIHCGRITRSTDPEFEGAGEGPEYETCTMLGPNCGIDNLAAITKANYLCNELGIDTISAGGTIGCAMELYERGYLKEEEVGYQLNFGNAKAMVELVKKMGLRQDFGDALAEGAFRLAERYGHPELFMGVKKQEFPAYHVQGIQGTGLEFATANTGASHNRAGVYNLELWGIPREVDPLSTEGKAALCVSLQNQYAAVDASGLCQFLPMNAVQEPEGIVPLLEAATGVGYTTESMLLAGERIWNVERLFNLAAGLTAKDDTLPKRLLEQPMLKGNAEGQVNRLYEMLPEYYQLRGWDENGVPTQEKLDELGLS
jgi:aldehyde:ferredoxin oxidoreductase